MKFILEENDIDFTNHVRIVFLKCLFQSLFSYLVLPGGKPTGVLCGEPSAPLRRGGNPTANNSADVPVGVRSCLNHESRKKLSET